MVDRNAALLIIDMQMVMQHRIESGREHVNGDAPAKIAALAASFRDANLPVVHVRHADPDPASPLHPSAEGHRAMACASEVNGEAVFVKTSSSAFATTDLETWLREGGIAHLYICGAVAGFCVNSTVRAASDLGFAVTVVRDAVIGFDLPSAGLSAESIFVVTMSLLEADFATLSDGTAVIDAVSITPSATDERRGGRETANLPRTSSA